MSNQKNINIINEILEELSAVPEYFNLLNPSVADAQVVYSIRNDLKIFQWIWDEDEQLEHNPSFWFANEEDLMIFLRSASNKEIAKILQ